MASNLEVIIDYSYQNLLLYFKNLYFSLSPPLKIFQIYQN
jgi:hypothetical protein